LRNPATAKHAVAAVLLLAALGSSCSRRDNAVEAASIKPVSERRPAPDFALKDENGATVRLSDYRGKVVLLNFWATWCAPCKIEIPWFVQFESQYKDKGFAVIGISMDEGGWDEVKPYLRRVNVNYRILMGDDEVARKYGGVDALPTSFLIDRDGRIASTHVGLVSKQDYQADIDALLAGESKGLRRSGKKIVLAGQAVE
jgi:peroxiredoxin